MYLAKFLDPGSYKAQNEIVRLDFPQAQIISNDRPGYIVQSRWGIKELNGKKYGKGDWEYPVEKIQESPEIMNAIGNRCLIIMDGFISSHKGNYSNRNRFQKCLVTMLDNRLFSCAGLFFDSIDDDIGLKARRFIMLTVKANEFMKRVDNYTYRMPIVLEKSEERAWLDGKSEIQAFVNREHIQMKVDYTDSEKITKPGFTYNLFD